MPPTSQKTPRSRRPATRPTPRHRLVIATTGEPQSRGALRFASSMCERFPSAAVLALGVSPPFPQNVSAMLALRQQSTIDEESRRELLDQVRRVVADTPGAEGWETMALTGAPSEEINRIAERWGATMLILGLEHHTRLGQIFGAETSVAVMRHARIPFIAVPPTSRGLPERALVAMDFTDASMAAAFVATQLVPQHGVLYIAHVCAFAGAPAEPGDLIDLYRTGALAKLDEVVAKIRPTADCAIESVMLEGEPADAILKLAKRERCSLIALGGHEQGLLDRILLGSIRTKVLRGATCAVLIAPPTPRES